MRLLRGRAVLARTRSRLLLLLDNRRPLSFGTHFVRDNSGLALRKDGLVSARAGSPVRSLLPGLARDRHLHCPRTELLLALVDTRTRSVKGVLGDDLASVAGADLGRTDPLLALRQARFVVSGSRTVSGVLRVSLLPN